MHLLPHPPYLRAVNRLDTDTRRIVLSLLNHPTVSRLKTVQQLGFTSRVFANATHSRWAHTLWTLERLCGLLDASPALPREVKQHLLAACVLQDVGHSPMSNSLGPAFSRHLTDERLSLLVPHDKVRTILILEHRSRDRGPFINLGARHVIDSVPSDGYSRLGSVVGRRTGAHRLHRITSTGGSLQSATLRAGVQRRCDQRENRVQPVPPDGVALPAVLLAWMTNRAMGATDAKRENE